MKNGVWIVTGIFLLAAGVVAYVLWRTDQTLKDAQAAANSAHNVTSDIKDLTMAAKNAWTDLSGIQA